MSLLFIRTSVNSEDARTLLNELNTVLICQLCVLKDGKEVLSEEWNGYTVHFSDCVASDDLKKLPEMLAYNESKGCCKIRPFTDKYKRRKAILGSQY